MPRAVPAQQSAPLYRHDTHHHKSWGTAPHIIVWIEAICCFGVGWGAGEKEVWDCTAFIIRYLGEGGKGRGLGSSGRSKSGIFYILKRGEGLKMAGHIQIVAASSA